MAVPAGVDRPREGVESNDATGVGCAGVGEVTANEEARTVGGGFDDEDRPVDGGREAWDGVAGPGVERSQERLRDGLGAVAQLEKLAAHIEVVTQLGHGEALRDEVVVPRAVVEALKTPAVGGVVVVVQRGTCSDGALSGRTELRVVVTCREQQHTSDHQRDPRERATGRSCSCVWGETSHGGETSRCSTSCALF